MRPLSSLSDIRKLPVLTRSAFQEAGPRISARSLPPGTEVMGHSFTSGTSGVPIRVSRTNLGELRWAAFCMRDLEWSGMDPLKRLCALRLIVGAKPGEREVSSDGWLPSSVGLFRTGPAFAMDVRQDVGSQIAWLRGRKPNYLIGMPSNLDAIAQSLDGERLEGLELVQTIGEPLPPEVRTSLESGFGVPVKNLYSSIEMGYMASECPEGHGLHVHAEGMVSEVLDDDGKPVGPGQTGRLVVTSLHNFATPFVRYEIQDEVTLGPGPCPCGRGLPLWSHVEGRRHPMLHLHGGRKKASTGLMLEIRKVGGFRQFQAVQTSLGRVLVRVVPGPGWSADRAQAIRAAVTAEMEGAATVEVHEMRQLEARNGKVRIIEVLL